jgi:hypothetical protein
VSEVIAFHEAVPGQYMQLTIAVERAELPLSRMSRRACASHVAPRVRFKGLGMGIAVNQLAIRRCQQSDAQWVTPSSQTARCRSRLCFPAEYLGIDHVDGCTGGESYDLVEHVGEL